MDVREANFWAEEAERNRLFRRLELYTSSLMPWQGVGTIRSVMDALRADIEAIDQDPRAIKKADEENERLIAEANRAMKERREKRRAQQAAGIQPARKKLKRPAAKGRLIR